MAEIELPLLHDHHTHPLLYAAFESGVNLADVETFEQAADLITATAGKSELVIAHAWKDNRFSISTEQLESLPPVAVFNLSLHAVVLNSRAKRILEDKFGSTVSEITNQHWFERNLRHVLNWFATLAGSPAALVAFYERLERLGIGSAEEMLLVGEQEIDWFEESGMASRTKFWAAPDTFVELSSSAKAKIQGIKLFTDGAFGARTAAVTQAYVDQSRNTGMLIYDEKKLQETLRDASQLKNAIAIHAIGDAAIEQTITAIEQTNINKKFDLIRIEHAQLISLKQAQRAKELGITLSMQPNFSSDSVAYSDRLPPAFCKQNNPFRMLIDEAGFVPGKDLIFGSDGMPHGAQYAFTEATEPSLASQKLTKDEFLAGYQKTTR